MTASYLPKLGPILIIAPHPDDESLGCGGLIAQSQQNRERLHIVFVTDGGASHPASVLWSRSRLVACRKREASEALGRLGAGLSERTFLSLADAEMPTAGSPAYRTARDRLVSILGDFCPKLVIVPWRRDPHRDHRDSWLLVMDCLKAVAQSPDILEYTIWLDELGEPDDFPKKGEMEQVTIDISDKVAIKRHAVEAHLSQLGGLIKDDPTAFVLNDKTIDRLTGPQEIYWRPCATV